MDAYEGKVSVIDGQAVVFENGTWTPEPKFVIISGPHTADEAADRVPFSVEEWFTQPVFINTEAGTYIAQHTEA